MSEEQTPARAVETTRENPWPLSLYSRKFAQHIQNAPSAWIEAEIVSLKRYNNAAYLKLKDLNDDAFLPASSFVAPILQKLDNLKEGSHIVCQAKPSFWVKRGEISMTMMDVHEVGTGDMLLRIEQLRKRLAEEGLFAPDCKKSLPFLPKTIGLICGKNAQAKDDVLENVRKRWGSQAFEIREVLVGSQPNAPATIIAALEELDALPDVEVIIIARGGGALEEVVFPFSDESLIRAVSLASTPVISAIGHETDYPILDDVADFRASTPTDAAKNVVPNLLEEMEIIEQLSISKQNALANLLAREQQFLASLTSRPVLANPAGFLEPKLQDIADLTARLGKSFAYQAQREAAVIETCTQKLQTLNPNNTLRRGYAIVFKDSATQNSVANFKKDDPIKIKLSDGEVLSRVSEVLPTKHS